MSFFYDELSVRTFTSISAESAQCSVDDVMQCVKSTGRQIIDYFTYGGKITDICRYKITNGIQ